MHDDWLVAVNTSTGDIVGSVWPDNGRYRMQLLGPQREYLRDSDGKKLAGPVRVPAHGTRTVDLP